MLLNRDPHAVKQKTPLSEGSLALCERPSHLREPILAHLWISASLVAHEQDAQLPAKPRGNRRRPSAGRL